MTSAVASTHKKRKWYNDYQFPLVPVLEIREANEHNTRSLSFSWLFIKLWTLDTPTFEVSLVAGSHWGIGIAAIIPYLRIILCIPCPRRVDEFIYRYLSRKPYHRK